MSERELRQECDCFQVSELECAWARERERKKERQKGEGVNL